MPTDRHTRFARQIALPQVGADGQATLARSHALVIGLGGLGSAASLYLASSGVGRMTINDFDRVDSSNLPRQILFDADDVGTAKTAATARHLRHRCPTARIDESDARLTDEALLDAVTASDIVLDCTDNFVTRGRINQACRLAEKPLVTGAAIRFEGQLAVFRHDEPGGPCYNCLYSEADENLETCAGQGILAPVVGTIGCMMATETLKVLLGLGSRLTGRLWVYDALAGTTTTLTIKKRSDCPVCG